MKLTRENYFSEEAEREYLGSSSFKSWDVFHGGCEAKELAKSKGEWKDKEGKALLVGSFVHAWNEGDKEFNKFIDENKSKIYQKNGKPYADFVKAATMIDVLEDDSLVSKVREGQKEQIFTGEIEGVKFKIQVDILNLEKNYFADLKTTANLSETYYNPDIRKRETFIDKYDYKLQIALYAEILRQNLGMTDYLDPFLIVVDKQDIPDHEVIFMGKSFIPEKLEEIKSRLPHILAVRNGEIEPIGCGKCEYCRSKKKLKKPVSLTEYELSLEG